MKKMKRLFSMITLTMFLFTFMVTPVQAAGYNSTSYSSVIGMIKGMFPNFPTNSAPAPAPTPAPAPAPTPAPTPEPAPAPAPTPEPAPAPAPKPEPAPTPAPAPAPEQKPTTSFQFTAYEKRVAELVNIERQKRGLKPVVLDVALTKAARAKAKDMVTKNYFSHTSPTWGSFGSQLKYFGIRYTNAGENIAAGQRSAESVVKAWMNSPGHRANILSSKFGKMGVGYAYKNYGNYRHYWAQWFTN